MAVNLAVVDEVMKSTVSVAAVTTGHMFRYSHSL